MLSLHVARHIKLKSYNPDNRIIKLVSYKPGRGIFKYSRNVTDTRHLAILKIRSTLALVFFLARGPSAVNAPAPSVPVRRRDVMAARGEITLCHHAVPGGLLPRLSPIAERRGSTLRFT